MIDRTIKPGDLVRVEAWVHQSKAHNNTRQEDNLALVTKIDDTTVFADQDVIVHLLFSGQDAGSLAMLSRLSRVNPISI